MSITRSRKVPGPFETTLSRVDVFGGTRTVTRCIVYQRPWYELHLYALSHDTPVWGAIYGGAVRVSWCGFDWRRLALQGLAPAHGNAITDPRTLADMYEEDTRSAHLLADSSLLDSRPLGMDPDFTGVDVLSFDAHGRAGAFALAAFAAYECPDCGKVLPEPVHGKATRCAACGADLRPGIAHGRSAEAYVNDEPDSDGDDRGVSLYILDDDDNPIWGQIYDSVIEAGLDWRLFVQGFDPVSAGWCSLYGDDLQSDYTHAADPYSDWTRIADTLADGGKTRTPEPWVPESSSERLFFLAAGFSYECPSCGKVLPEPAHGRATRCAECGADLYPGIAAGKTTMETLN